MADCGHFSCRTYVTITFNDGTTDQHRCHTVQVRDGVLFMHEASGGSDIEVRCIPLDSIREYQVKEYR